MALATSLVVLFYCCATADILTKLLQQCFLFFIVVVIPVVLLGNSQVSVYRTIGPTLVFLFMLENIDCGYSLEPLNEAVLTCTHKYSLMYKE